MQTPLPVEREYVVTILKMAIKVGLASDIECAKALPSVPGGEVTKILVIGGKHGKVDFSDIEKYELFMKTTMEKKTDAPSGPGDDERLDMARRLLRE